MRMSGYPTKPESISFSRSGRWLASSGADTVVLWPFFGGGPMGNAADGTGRRHERPSRVARHVQSAQRCGRGSAFADGRVVLADIESQKVAADRAAGS